MAASFEEPEYTAYFDALGVLRILEAIRIFGLEKKSRFYRASTTERFGLVQETPRKEPRSPAQPLRLRQGVRLLDPLNCRDAYGMYAYNGNLKAAARDELVQKHLYKAMDYQ